MTDGTRDYTQQDIYDELSHYAAGVGLRDLKAGKLSEQIEQYDETMSWIQEHDVHVMHSRSHHRHFKLKKLVAAPYIITAVGDLSLLDQPLLGVVGPRKISIYAQEILSDFFDAVSDYRLVTISGGAVGVDTVCHTKSLEAGIPTIVVLGEGLRRVMGSSRRHFIQQVVDTGGLVMSEFPLDMPAAKRSFPQRNRIVAGMSEMLFVPAAGKKSGSLISVDYALQMHIPTYTVPGSLYDATSAGTNEYLNARKITGVHEFAPLLSKYFAPRQAPSHHTAPVIHVTDSQQGLLARLPATKSALVGAGVSLADLTMLEISGQIMTNERGEIVRK